MKHEVFRARPRRFRVLAGLVAVVVIGMATVAVAANARKGRDEGNPAPPGSRGGGRRPPGS